MSNWSTVDAVDDHPHDGDVASELEPSLQFVAYNPRSRSTLRDGNSKIKLGAVSAIRERVFAKRTRHSDVSTGDREGMAARSIESSRSR
jgi:hypothetical protein